MSSNNNQQEDDTLMKRQERFWMIVLGFVALTINGAAGAMALEEEHFSYYVDNRTGEQIEYSVPFYITAVRRTITEQGTEFRLYTKGKLHSPAIEHAAFTVEIAYDDVVVAYGHNYMFPGLLGPGQVGVVRYGGADLLAVGTIYFQQDHILIRVPMLLASPRIALMRYLPSQEVLEHASGGLFSAVTSFVRLKQTVRGVLPPWPSPHFLQQRWQPGQQVSVPSSPNDRPNLGERVRGSDTGIWPRDISLTDDPYLDIGNGKLLGWGIEQGWSPNPGYDGSDAWVGIVGEDRNGDGKLQPGEVTGVIGRCGEGAADNNYYVDENGYVHWENYNPDGSLRRHYIYDPNRDILKIYEPGKKEHIYMGPPQRW